MTIRWKEKRNGTFVIITEMDVEAALLCRDALSAIRPDDPQSVDRADLLREDFDWAIERIADVVRAKRGKV